LIIIIRTYRSPNGNFALFLKNIDTVLSQYRKPGSEIILCGDINIDYLNEKCHKYQQLDTLLTSYNLTSTVRFPIRSVNGTSSATDNIFIDKTHVGNYTLHPLINGLSDYDGQILQLTNLNIPTQSNETKIIRNFSKHNIHNFKTHLSYEIWDTVFGKHDVDEIFNSFHNTFLRIFHSSFPEKKIQMQNKDKTWITKGIQTSIKNKRELYLKCRISNNHKLKNYYKAYCKLLAKTIRQAKTLHYSNQILKSDNKSRTVWDIVKSQTGKKVIKDEMSILDTNGAIIHNKQKIANSFNDYFSTIAENLLQPYHAGNTMKQTNSTLKSDSPTNISKPYPNMKYKYTSTQEIEKIIKSLKSKNAHGYDGVSTRILKCSAPYISSPLTYIFNKALEKGVYPTRL